MLGAEGNHVTDHLVGPNLDYAVVPAVQRDLLDLGPVEVQADQIAGIGAVRQARYEVSSGLEDQWVPDGNVGRDQVGTVSDARWNPSSVPDAGEKVPAAWSSCDQQATGKVR